MLDFEVSFRLLVLAPSDWDEHADFPVYGMPQTVGGDTILVGVEHPTFFDDVVRVFWPDLSDETRRRMLAVYGDPPSLGHFSDLLVVHELTHLFHEQVPFRFPRLWLDELFANLGLVGYVATDEADMLAVLTTIANAALDVPPERMAVTSLDQMAQALEASPVNYCWHEFLLIAGAKAIWDARGERSLRDLHRSFREMMSDAEVVEALRTVDPEAERLAVEWPHLQAVSTPS